MSGLFTFVFFLRQPSAGRRSVNGFAILIVSPTIMIEKPQNHAPARFRRMHAALPLKGTIAISFLEGFTFFMISI